MTVWLKMAWPNTVRTLHKLVKAAEKCAKNAGKKTIFGKDKFHNHNIYLPCNRDYIFTMKNKRDKCVVMLHSLSELVICN